MNNNYWNDFDKKKNNAKDANNVHGHIINFSILTFFISNWEFNF